MSNPEEGQRTYINTIVWLISLNGIAPALVNEQDIQSPVPDVSRDITLSPRYVQLRDLVDRAIDYTIPSNDLAERRAARRLGRQIDAAFPPMIVKGIENEEDCY